MDDPGTTARLGQFVTLGIAQEVFAVPVDTVVEILDLRPVFRVPDAPAYLAGLIDVRGRGVPVIDLRVKLGLPAAGSTEHTRILVLEVAVTGRRIVLGLIADRVFEVMALDLGALEAPPDIGVAWRCDYISGIGRRGESFVIVLNLQRLFSSDEVASLGRTAASEAPPRIRRACERRSEGKPRHIVTSCGITTMPSSRSRLASRP